MLQGMRPENLVDCYDDFELLKNEDLYFIVTTDEPKAFWSFSDNFNNAWREINDGDIYSNEQLKDFALDEIKELEQSERLILRGVNKEEIRQSIFEKVNSLNSIVRRKQFLQEVARRSKVLGAENNFDFLDSLCEQAHNDVQSFQLWFDYSLNDEDRMLVIGLSAFYGMSAEQTFAMLDRVVDEVWRPRRSNLPYYDYGDIQKSQHILR
ncbi:MAG: hypothetical protein HZT40_04195 [Candidatus Thiothrix singaporensis]|uniref:Uncharacterized protein n=1 Tax=Candidatus Thiothrix singaporensis TaxID=2799669 RepID=A0A7L6APC4_9GAMM|nr:MAG: hypothetical protein HZT40_04195 [Candidatus Thiothrix singaporensis]